MCPDIKLGCGVADQFIPGVPCYSAVAIIDLENPAIFQAGNKHGLWTGTKGYVEFFLRFSQSCLGVYEFRDIRGYGNHALFTADFTGIPRAQPLADFTRFHAEAEFFVSKFALFLHEAEYFLLFFCINEQGEFINVMTD